MRGQQEATGTRARTVTSVSAVVGDMFVLLKRCTAALCFSMHEVSSRVTCVTLLYESLDDFRRSSNYTTAKMIACVWLSHLYLAL